ncbi:LUD domain-containing protein [Salinibaculum salinum]|uniref:LUD domain-containing protein n=1 Tax=Salinibaculum salinum TaxID=3131996 RepID=UPI0030EB3DAB
MTASQSPPRSVKAARIRHLLETEGDAVAENTRGFNQGRYDSVAKLDDYEGLKAEAREIKEDAIERLPELLDKLEASVEANGGTVYIAEDEADANRHIREICDDVDADRVIKSKSMTSEEIEVNEHLQDGGIDVVETDLGEWVLQLAEEAPSHIVAPAIHKSREEIAELFAERFDLDEPLESAKELTHFARERLGEQILEADVGMTGANFLTADSGTMALVTSEGNARKTVAVPDTHIAVAGVEKVVPSVEDLAPFVELIGRSGTGQDITSYLSLFTPPVGAPTVHDDEEPLGESDDRDFHLVLIDNGRLAMRDDDQLRETLYCIRCSACSNSCGNFQSVGGHAFGGETYSGGIATGWEAGIEGLDTAAEFNDLCTGCSRCVDACPVGIDIPWINTVVRDRINRGADPDRFDSLVEGLTPDEEPGGLSLRKRFFGNFSTIAKVGGATAPLSNWVADTSVARAAMERFLGVDRRRDLPTFARTTFREWADQRESTVDDPAREAVVYPDLYTNRVAPERGKATVRALEALGVEVTVPEAPSSGRAPLSQGMVATAEKHAHGVYAALAEHIDAGRDIVVVEPSALAMFEREYEQFLPEQSQERLADASYEVLEYVYGRLENGADASRLSSPTDTGTDRVAYHGHCQGRTLGVDSYTETVLRQLGYDVRTSDTECCGMAGSFGYKTDYYELSMDVGEPIREQFTDADGRDRTVLASGTSCLDQLDALLDRPNQHPIELVAPN